MKVGIKHLLLAYRKAKYEAFRDTTCGGYGLKFMQFEERLRPNLRNLQATLESGDWARDMSFLGGVAFVPKEVEPPKNDARLVRHQTSDLMEQWRRMCADGKATAEFRSVISASVDYLVISALWILKVGHLFDAALGDCAMGNRLKRQQDAAHALDEYAFELFRPYYGAYGKWQRDGLKAMRNELESRRGVLAVTMDLKRFYHNVDASFILDERFLKKVGVSLQATQTAFTQSLLESFDTFNCAVANLTATASTKGLPVGLAASSVIANVLLAELDTQIQKKLLPVYSDFLISIGNWRQFPENDIAHF